MNDRWSRLLSFGLAAGLLASCARDAQEKTGADPYLQEIEAWHARRVARLISDDGWLSLAGLFWLHEGVNRFGSGKGNDIVFPERWVPKSMGAFVKHGDSIEVRIEPGVDVRCDGRPVGRQNLRSDAEGKPDILTYRSLRWYVIKRGGRYAVRLKDSQNPVLKRFRGIEHFPVDVGWRLAARFERYDSAKVIEVPTAVGTVAKLRCPGRLVFRYRGQSYHLVAAADPGDRSLFVIFGDRTNGIETHGAGRFLTVDLPPVGDSTFVDFNKAYNPPCAFTPYATCPLPPPENILPFRVTAGEKSYVGGALRLSTVGESHPAVPEVPEIVFYGPVLIDC